ncbi:hypothetical protein [Streptomyces halobius]|uniref:IrrE N-terminal-like domain-containing protein n=1 Tax=Streptomyces halobius TaxID=2879846 RepID=A0ABY4MJC2_9ACTN|nr:hypothetical protein [Streptomyces halobius]UQA97653.1 hypothetical protein K9S39_07685 [Streptomyces halobius]
MVGDLLPTAERDRIFYTWRRTGAEDGTSMRVGRIRRRCKQLIRELELPASTDLRGMCDIVATRVGRPVHMVPMSLGGVVSGMTAATDDGYWVFFELKTSPWHQAHIVLHELSHLLLGHGQDPAITEDALRMWTPSVDAATAMRRMGLTMGFARHHGYDNLAERETEVLGTLLMERVVPSAGEREFPLEGQAAELAAALGPALQHIRRQQEGLPGDAEEIGASGGVTRADGGGGPRV